MHIPGILNLLFAKKEREKEKKLKGLEIHSMQLVVFSLDGLGHWNTGLNRQKLNIKWKKKRIHEI